MSSFRDQDLNHHRGVGGRERTEGPAEKCRPGKGKMAEHDRVALRVAMTPHAKDRAARVRADGGRIFSCFS